MEEGGVEVRPYCSCFTLEDDINESNRRHTAAIAAYDTLSEFSKDLSMLHSYLSSGSLDDQCANC